MTFILSTTTMCRTLYMVCSGLTRQIRDIKAMTEPRKPSNLLYGLNDRPPLGITLALGLQHVFILFISLIFPAIIVNLLGNGIDAHSARSFVSLSMIAGGILTILQAVRTKHFGSGYLCPAVCGPSYLSASILAVTTGGLPLLFGMTAFAGAIEAAFSRVMNRLRFLFTAEVMGIIVALIGIVIIPVAIKNFFGLSGTDTVTTTPELIVAVITLATMIGINVWVKGNLRLYSIIIGMVVGYGLSWAFGILDSASLSKVGEADWFSIPYISNMGWSFDVTMVVPFIVATICSTFKTVGDLGTCQKINDADWKRLDMERVTPGILVDGIGGILPGTYWRIRSIHVFEQCGPFRCYRVHQQGYCLCRRRDHHCPCLFPAFIRAVYHHAAASYGRYAHLCYQFHDYCRIPDNRHPGARCAADLCPGFRAYFRAQRRSNASTVRLGPPLDQTGFQFVAGPGNGYRYCHEFHYENRHFRSSQPYAPTRPAFLR